MKKDSFIFYRSYFNAIETLPVEQQQKLYRAIAVMSLNDKIPKVSGMAKGIFSAIQPQIAANKKRYENGLKGKEFGKLGGRPGNQKKSAPDSLNQSVKINPIGVIDSVKKDAEIYLGGVLEDDLFETPNENVNDNENENVNVNENENENENVNAADADQGMRMQSDCMQTYCTQNDFVQSGKIGNERNSPKIDYGAVTEDYNRICISLPAVKCLTDARRTAIKARIAEHTAEKVHEVFVKAEKSDFLSGRFRPHAVCNRSVGRGLSGRDSPSTGQHGNWRASFDWLLNKANFVKVLEGNYDNNPGFDTPSDLDDVFPG